MIEEILKQLGFNPKEVEVYLTILKHGKITPPQIAKVTGIKRPTVYSVTKELLEKRVIAEDFGDTKSSLFALSLESLENLILQEERKVKDKKKLVAKAITELQEFTKNVEYSIPKIRFVSEENLNDYLYSQYKYWEKSGNKYDNVWWGYHDHSFTLQYQKWIDWIWKTTTKDLKVRFLTDHVGAEGIEKEMEKKHPERKTVVLKDSKFDTCLWVIGDYIIMVQTREKPNYLVEIHDPVLARNQKALFKKIWSDLQTAE